MKSHPFSESVRYRVFASLVLVAAFIIQVLLLLYYGEENLLSAILDSLVFIVVFSVPGYFSWYMISLLYDVRKQAAIILLVVILCVSMGHITVFTISPESGDRYLHSIPLRILFCVMALVILFQWYRYYFSTALQEETLPAEEEREIAGEKDHPAIDRVTVKDGSRIHIIPLEELVYIQASGDYVTLFTNDKQYIKEQTMKSLVSQLPRNFIRIHRSVIVNSLFIARIELFEKQSYRIRLKNGLYLKVSAAGYKQLREDLLL